MTRALVTILNCFSDLGPSLETLHCYMKDGLVPPSCLFPEKFHITEFSLYDPGPFGEISGFAVFSGVLALRPVLIGRSTAPQVG